MTNISPWADMVESSQRRIDFDTKHNIFWITDLQGNYGFCLQNNRPFKKIDNKIKLKGISIIKRNSITNYGELFLILKEKENWHIFHTLCKDLISITHQYDTEEKMISAIEIRLKRWQQLLKRDVDQELTIEKQMGLFSELLCLKDIVAPQFGIKQAVVSWVGPEFDKQDFLMDNAIIEVKSYRTSKGKIVHISSLQQLYSPKEPLFLLANGLTCSENGLSIEDVCRSIKEVLKEESIEYTNMFENKLMEYGYIPEFMKNPLYKFILDKQNIYYISDGFPKISIKDVKSQITAVRYSIDLSQCDEYEVGVELLFSGGDNSD